eukprot:TRINITY_DN623_c0_g1_i3.p1 TRINITY_DN623_c0_g1~~TRINITY_DN623_c0_g1_i3.p1  ORF type:complete len:166 (-),score=24.73 TRINITY_DN623_c0_g1_i3:774-1271(-)
MGTVTAHFQPEMNGAAVLSRSSPARICVTRTHSLRACRFGADFYSFWWGGVRGLVINTPLLAAPEGDSVRAQQQATWLEQELELAQLNAHHLMVFGHHPWFLRGVGEEPDAVVTPLPKAVRLKWLSKMGQCKVRLCKFYVLVQCIHYVQCKAHSLAFVHSFTCMC